MYSLKQAKGFQGVDLILYKEELNILIDAINVNIEEADKKFMPEFSDKMKSLKKVLCDYAYYDVEEEEVHCRMGYYELQLTMEILFSLKTANGNDHFKELAANEQTKKWTHKDKT